jgi:hypothetical protein
MMTFCPDFVNDPDVDNRAFLILHEGSHGTAGLHTRDIAYYYQREINTIPQADALQNTDSYTLLIMNLHTPGIKQIGPAAPDTVGGVNCPGGNADLCRAIAFSAKWFELSEWDVSNAYGTVVASLGPGAPWPDPYNRDTVHLLAPLFVLTDPGASTAGPAPGPPNNGDKIRLAGIHDRYDRLSGLADKAVTATMGNPGPESWVDGTPNSTLTLGVSYAAELNDTDRVRHIAFLLISSTASIDPRLRNAYRDGADRIRRHNGHGP